MRAIVCGLSLIILQSCSTPIEKSTDSPSIVGAWFPLKDWDPECASLALRYHADGSFSDPLDKGVWRMSGNKLTEITTVSSPEQMDWSPDDIGKPFRSTIHWVDENTFAKRYADGEVVVWRRCPDSH